MRRPWTPFGFSDGASAGGGGGEPEMRARASEVGAGKEGKGAGGRKERGFCGREKGEADLLIAGERSGRWLRWLCGGGRRRRSRRWRRLGGLVPCVPPLAPVLRMI